MEKVRINYKKFIFVGFFITTSLILISIFLKANNLEFFPLLYLINLFVILYLYVVENYTSDGLYVGHNGIGHCKKKGIVDMVEWNNVIVRKNIIGLSIFLGLKNKFYIDSSKMDSIATLASKYCPQDHELYKIVKKYTSEKNIPL